MNKRVFLMMLGISWLMTSSILLYTTFLMAYFNPDYQVRVLVNNFGEAHLEFILFPICLVAGFWTIYQMIKSTVNICIKDRR